MVDDIGYPIVFLQSSFWPRSWYDHRTDPADAPVWYDGIDFPRSFFIEPMLLCVQADGLLGLGLGYKGSAVAR